MNLETNRQTVLLRGGFHRNRGDELMALAVRDKVSSRWANTEFVRELKTGAYEDRARYGFKHLLWRPSIRHLSTSLGYLILARYRREFGIVLPKNVDVVFDVSGFFFTDEWPNAGLDAILKQYSRWKQSSVPIIVMPQSFGPFTKEKTRQTVQQIMRCATLVYARDKVSLDHLVECVGDKVRVHSAPDFTCWVKAIPSPIEPGYGCIIPNFRLVERHAYSRDEYLRLLSRAIERFEKEGIKPVVLLHAPEQDEEFGNWLVRNASGVELYKSRDPRDLKGVIGGAEVVVGSRFHGLVNAFNQAIPSIGIGWTAKFDELFGSYDCSEYLVQPESARQGLESALDLVFTKGSRQALVERLVRISDERKYLSELMWQEIFSTISQRHNVAHGI